jgi:hypothetical protein
MDEKTKGLEDQKRSKAPFCEDEVRCPFVAGAGGGKSVYASSNSSGHIENSPQIWQSDLQRNYYTRHLNWFDGKCYMYNG